MPIYTFPPAYSPLLQDGEARLEHSPSRRSRNNLTDTWLRTDGHVTIALADQQRIAAQPIYHRRGNIHGAMLLDNREVVRSVVIKLLGEIMVMNDEDSKTTKVVDLSFTLWPTSLDGPNQCPGAIPFAIFFPETYLDRETGTRFPIPPTFAASTSAVSVTVDYRVIVEVEDNRGAAMGLFSRDVNSFSFPISYRPRTRPSQPILYQPMFLSSVKSSPEEWRQSLITVKTKEGARVDPISCNLFIPALQVFAITDYIPIHIQVTSTLTSLLLFFSSRGPQPPSPSESAKHLSVKLVRQVSVKIKGKTTMRNMLIGGCGTLRPVPPPAFPSPPRPGHIIQEHMDWEGEVKCNPDVAVGGFSAAECTIKDFIILEIYPPADSPFMLSKNGVGVLIVTDPWTDEVTD